MTTNILVTFYSSYGHTFELAKAVTEGAKSVEGSEVRLTRVPELPAAKEAMSTQDAYVQAQEAMADLPETTLDDLRWADGVLWGTPTRYGNMTAQLKQLIDTTGALWQEGALEDKPAGIFSSANNTNGGQEATILTTMIPLLHLGMVIVGTPYGQNPQLFTDKPVGSSPYGPAAVAGPDGSKAVHEDDLAVARSLGERVAKVAKHLKALRGS